MLLIAGGLQAEGQRVTDIHAYELAKLKKAVLAYGKPEIMRIRVGDIIKEKKEKDDKAKLDEAIREAVAKAKAEPRGLMGMFVWVEG